MDQKFIIWVVSLELYDGVKAHRTVLYRTVPYQAVREEWRRKAAICCVQVRYGTVRYGTVRYGTVPYRIRYCIRYLYGTRYGTIGSHCRVTDEAERRPTSPFYRASFTLGSAIINDRGKYIRSAMAGKQGSGKRRKPPVPSGGSKKKRQGEGKSAFDDERCFVSL